MYKNLIENINPNIKKEHIKITKDYTIQRDIHYTNNKLYLNNKISEEPETDVSEEIEENEQELNSLSVNKIKELLTKISSEYEEIHKNAKKDNMDVNYDIDGNYYIDGNDDKINDTNNKKDNIDTLLLINMNIINKYTSISDNRKNFLLYIIKNIKNIKLIEEPINKNILKEYPNIKLIINYVMGPGGGLLNEQILFSDIIKHNIKIKIGIWIEDCQYVDFLSPYINDINFVILSIKHNKIAKQYYIKNNNLHIYHMDHFIDDNIFKDYYLPKKYDIILYGYINNIYSFRGRLLNILSKNKDKFKFKYIKHPGYHNNNNNNNITGKNLSKLLNQSYLTICTKSNYDMMLKKYLESSFSNSMPCGDIPTDYREILEDKMVEINDNMRDDEILLKIIKSLHNKEKLMIDTIILKKRLCNKYNYINGFRRFAYIINKIINN